MAINHIYREVWSAARGRYVVAPESARGGHGCGGMPRTVKALCVVSLAALAEVVGALPVDGVVVGGSGAISQTPNTLTVNQASSKLALNWQRFNIAAGEAVNFVQPGRSAIALNRVLGAEASAIYGQLSANGQVFLVNSNGILFGRGAQVNVGGLVASTLDLSVSDFMAGKRTFSGSGGRVDNLGSLSAGEGGYITLLGGQVSNQGTITANLGTVALAAGNRVSLDFAGDKLLSLLVEQGAIDSLVENGQLIRADGGAVILTARAAGEVLNGVVNTTGIETASGITSENGVIRLSGASSQVINSGTIQARSVGAASGHIALLVESEANATSRTATALVSGVLDVSGLAAGEKGGKIDVFGDQVGLLSGARIDARGDIGGGTVRVGGDLHGQGVAPTALRMLVQSGANIDASAIHTGNGGKVSLWADGYTSFAGTVLARGGAVGGDGGFVETSGHVLGVAGSVNVGAAAGRAGTWLLDPWNVTIQAAGADTNAGASPNFAASGSGAIVTTASLQSALATGNVQVTTGSTGSENGDITVASPISWNANALTLSAARNIAINAALNGSGTASLALNYGQGAVALGNLATYTVNAPVNLPTGNSFSTTLGLGGATVNYYVINSLGAAGSITGTDLQGMRGNLTGNYALGSNIDAAATRGWNSGAGFLPVGSSDMDTPVPGTTYTGKFEGLGHSISNLFIDRPTTDFVGLFGAVGTAGTVSNVGLVGGSAIGRQAVGGLVGENAGTISRSYNTGSVSSSGSGGWISFIGGLVGYNKGSISLSYATGDVGVAAGTMATFFSMGGLVGEDYKGTISNSYATGKVVGATTRNSSGFGGLIGYTGYGTYSNVYATGDVSGYTYVGGLVGQNYGGAIGNAYASGHVSSTSGFDGGLVGTQDKTGTTTNGYWNVTTSGETTSRAGTGLDATQVKTAANFAGFNFSTTPGATGNNWVMVDSDGSLNNVGGATGALMPMLASEYSATINNAHQLQLMSLAPGASYTLASNIDATATATGKDAWGGAGFVPVGNATTKFTGSLDGLGHSISGLFINRPTTDGVGLFGTIGAAGTVSNVGLVGGSVVGKSDVGGLAGDNAGVISRSYNTGSVSSSGSGFVAAIGGLVGGNTGTITLSYATGDVSVAAGVMAYYMGGLVGSDANGTISNSYASGNVTGPTVVYGDSFGGLLGFAQGGSYSNVYATGNVSGYANVGGLVGRNRGGAISNAYASGQASASWSFVGGLTGVQDAGGTTTNGYWNKTTSGNATSWSGTGLDATQVKTASNFGGFNFTTTPGATGNNWVMVDIDGSLNNAGGKAGAVMPMLASEYTTAINNAHQLQLMSMVLGASYTLASNVNAVATATSKDVWGSAGFIPVGNVTTKFTGSLDGQQHTVSALAINQPDAYNMGLFGAIDAAGTVSNVGLVGGAITAGFYGGGLAGQNFGVISASYNTGSVSGGHVGSIGFGGLVGYNFGAISDSYASGNVGVGAGAPYAHEVGGLAGYDNGTITRSYASGNVNAGGSPANYVGGLVGSAFGSYTDVYATGSVTGYSHVGGLVGVLSSATGKGTITNAYATGFLTQLNGSAPGGLIGAKQGSDPIQIANSFWNTATTGTNTNGGYGGTAQTTALMMTGTTFSSVGWSLPGVWNIVDGVSYPYLTSIFTSAPQIVSGTAATGGGKTIEAAAGGAKLASTDTGANGFYYFALPGGSVAGGQTLVTYVAGDTVKGASAWGSTGTSITGLDISASTLGVIGGSVANSGLASARGALTSTDMLYSAAGSNLTLANQTAFLTAAGASYTLDGSVSSVGNQTYGSTVTLGADTTLNAGAGDIAFNGALSGAGHALTLAAGGAISQSAAITNVSTLSAAGASVALNHSGNTLANLGSTSSANGVINIADSAGGLNVIGPVTAAGGALTLSTVGDLSINGAVDSGSNAALLTATGSITLNAGISSTASGDALQLSGQRFINNVGANALTTPNGRWLVWSATPGNDTRGGLAYDFKQYNASYGVSSVLGSGKGFLYSAAPVINASLTGSVSKVYDATTTATLSAANYTSSGAIDGDSVTSTTPVSGTYDTKNVAAAKDVAVSGLAIGSATNGSATVYGYQLASTSINGAVGAITAASIAVNGITANNKVYDANTTASLGGKASVSALGSDVVSVAGAGSGAFADKNVGTAKTVTVSGYTLSGSDAGNYVIAQPTSVTADITVASLVVNGVSANNKVYDANTGASLSGTASVSALGGDGVSVAGTGSGAFADKNVGTAKTVTVSGYTLSGADAGNYVVVQPTGLTANISARPLNVTYGGVNKAYDGTVAATVTSTDDRLGSDALTVSRTAAFVDPNAGTAKQVNVSGASLSGAAAGNYVLASTTGVTSADITAAPTPTPTPTPTPIAELAPTPEAVVLENALSDLSRVPPDTVKQCCTTDTIGLAEQCDYATKPPNPLNTLLIVGGGVKQTNDIWATLY